MGERGKAGTVETLDVDANLISSVVLLSAETKRKRVPFERENALATPRQRPPEGVAVTLSAYSIIVSDFVARRVTFASSRRSSSESVLNGKTSFTNNFAII